MLRGESSSNSWRWTYHVFLSFRGEDTRLDFTDHLYAALVRKGIIAFRDDKQLEKGDAIAEELPKAIEESLGAIVILSENYASSSWCLDELNKILESNRVLGREVFPVFYGVSPGEVQHQKTESFDEAFKKHERRSGKDTEKMQKWRDSLKEIGQIPGWESKHYRHQTELIENIVESVWTKLRPKMPSFNDGLIGIGSRVKKMDSLLSIESEDVRFIGIWGMGGIGKTTLARVVFQKIKDQFDISCFLDNVREISKESNGMLRLQTKLLSHLAIKGLEIIDLDEGKNTIINLLSEKKVLLVLDDVDDTSQLENLAKRVEWFGRGSRVIITTRDTQVLISHGVVEYYNIEFLNSDESLQLLSQKAFKRDEPQDHYLELSKVVAKHAGGLPLALELLGSFLCGRSESQWREVVDMIKDVSASHIVMKSLRISYNGLPRRHKALFLDIACFFKGMVKELAIQALEICDRYPAVGIELLVEKSLATYDGFTIGMHDLLQETAKEIVIEESHVDAGKRSRLWSLEDTNQVLKYSRENESIEGIGLNSPEKDEANWDPEAFSRMYNLRLLIISFPIKLAHGLKYLCSSLKFLQWNDFSLETLPLGLQLDELVELKMYSSKIKNIWNGNQAFAKLKFIDLSYSEDLIQTPIVSGAPCLERMLLIGCINLVEVHPSVGQHKRLVVLSMKNCKNLQIMPRKLEMDSLEELILSGCSKVKKLPEFGKNMKSLSLLSVENCINLLCLPNSICNLKSLRKLHISGCSRLSSLPNGLNENESLEELDVSGTAIREITLSKIRLEKLKELSFGGRKELAPNSQNLLLWISKFMRQPNLEESTMPPLSSLLSLVSLDLSHRDLNDESFPSDLGSLSLLQELDLSGNNFVNPPAQCIINLFMLQNLSFNDCPRLESLPVLPPNLQGLYANNCPKLKPFNLDEEMLWKIFETQSRMDPIEGPEVWFIIPGNEIPCWFDNQNCLAIDSSYHPYDKLGCDSVTAITVDVPKDCQLSKWWGIAVCLVLEPSNMEEEDSSPSYVGPTSTGNEEMCIYYWVCKAPDRDPDPKFPIASKFGHLVYKFNDPYIHILFLSADHVYIQHYLSGEQIQLQLIFFVENCSKSCKATIKKCGCRVICKEKIEEWRKHSDGLNISRLTEVNDDEEFRHELVVEEPTSPNTSSSTDKTAVNTALDCDNA